MEYGSEKIKEFADERIEKLMNDENIVAILPNSASLYHQDREFRDSRAIRTANPNSRLFRAIFDE